MNSSLLKENDNIFFLNGNSYGGSKSRAARNSPLHSMPKRQLNISSYPILRYLHKFFQINGDQYSTHLIFSISSFTIQIQVVSCLL